MFDALMRACLIEILLVTAQCILEMGLVEDNNLVKAFFTHRPHPAFRMSVGAWCSKRSVNHFNACGLEDRIEGQTVLPVIVMDEMSE